MYVHEHTRRWHSSVVQNSKASAEFPSAPASSAKHIHTQRWVCLEFNFSFLAPCIFFIYKKSLSWCLAWSLLKPVTSVLSGSFLAHTEIFSQVQEKCPGQAQPVCCLLGEQVSVVVVVGELVKEGARLQDEGGQHHPGQVHARPQLLQQDPHQALVLLRDRFCLRRLSCLQRQRELQGRNSKTIPCGCISPGPKLSHDCQALAQGWLLTYTTAERHQPCLSRNEPPKQSSEWSRKPWVSEKAGTRQGAQLCCTPSWGTASRPLRAVRGQHRPPLAKGTLHCRPSVGVDMPRAVTASLWPGGCTEAAPLSPILQKQEIIRFTRIDVEKCRQ